MTRKLARNLRLCSRCEHHYMVKRDETEKHAHSRHLLDVMCRARFVELQVGRIGYKRSFDYTRTLVANGIKVIRIPATPNTGTNTLRIVPFAPALAVDAATYVSCCANLHTRRRSFLLWQLIEDGELMQTCDTVMMLGGQHAVGKLLEGVKADAVR